MKFPLRYKFLAIITASISVAFAIALYHYFQIVENNKQNTHLQNQAIAEQVAARFDSIIERSFAVLQTLALHPAVIARDGRASDRLFAQLLPGFPLHLNIVAADMEGNNYGSALRPDKGKAINYLDRKWFQQARAGSRVVGTLQVSRHVGVPTAVIALPVMDGGKQVGVVGMSLDLAKVRNSIELIEPLPHDSTSNIVDSSGNVVICICEDHAENEHGKGCETIALPTSFTGGHIQGVGSDGIDRLYGIAPIRNTDWKTVIGVPVSIAYSNASVAARRYLVVISGAAIMAALLAMLLSMNISRRVRSIIAAMREMERGNTAVQVPVQGSDELTVVAQSFNRMVHQRRTAGEELQRSASFVSTVLEGIGEGVIVIDRNFRILSANSGYCRQLKLTAEQVIGKTCHALSHHRDTPCLPEAEGGCSCAVRKCFETGSEQIAIHRHLDQRGAPLYVETRAYPLRDASGAVTSAVETLTDITERKQLEAQLYHAQKMEAIGVLAGGVAHDFNNLLTAIVGYANLLQIGFRADDVQRQHIAEILSAADRAAVLTRGLLAFSRKQIIEPAPIRLGDVVKNIESILRRIIGEDIDLRVELAPEELPILADATQIDQVIMNLCTNARDAMPKGGTVTIASSLAVFGHGPGRSHATLQDGAYMMLTVTDTGAGIDDATREKIFEPFFTTKGPGKGTGLGLSIIYGIVKQHHGAIDVESTPGLGTTFKVYLPVSGAAADMTVVSELAPVTGGSEVVLVAEDDGALLSLAVHILQSHGYQVIPARDGIDAVEKFRGHPGKVDLVILDVLMPRMNGKEAFDEIRKHQKDVPTLFMSGYAADVHRQKGILEEDVPFIPKPFSPRALLQMVRETLSDPSAAGPSSANTN